MPHDTPLWESSPPPIRGEGKIEDPRNIYLTKQYPYPKVTLS